MTGLLEHRSEKITGTKWFFFLLKETKQKQRAERCKQIKLKI